MFESLSIENFTVFHNTRFDFVKGVNVYAGENGTGNTHILKLLYALQKNQLLAQDASHREALDVTLMAVFKPDSLGRRVTRKRGIGACSIEARWNSRLAPRSLARVPRDSAPSL